MVDKLKLSIIIPHYNAPDKLERLLNSIPPREEIEIIVCDDASTKDIDKFDELVQKHPSIILPVAKNNTGAGGARNRGLNVARGEWVIFADSDDYFTPEMWDAISSCFESRADIIIFKPVSVYEGTNEIADRHQTSEGIVCDLVKDGYTTDGKADPGNVTEMKARYMMVLNLSRMIRRSFIEEHRLRFDEKMRYFEDALFAMSCGKLAGLIGACDTVIYVITKDEETETYSSDEKAIRQRLKCSYIRAKRLRRALSPRQRKLLNAGMKLVLTRYRSYLRYRIKRILYVIYTARK